MIDAATGVAGKIRPNDKVNIYATFEGEQEGEVSRSELIVSNAKVLDLGELTPLEPRKDDRNQASEAVPITFALNTADTQRVAYAESFAQHVRLALIAPGSDAVVSPDERTYTLDKDK